MDALTESQKQALAVFESSGGSGDPMTTSEVAEQLGIARRVAYGRLERMVDAGLLKTKKVGSRGRVWWRPVETVTDTQPSDQQLHEAKVFTESFLENQRDIIYAFDTDYDFFRWNDRLCEVTGYTDAEIAQMHPWTLSPTRRPTRR